MHTTRKTFDLYPHRRAWPEGLGPDQDDDIHGTVVEEQAEQAIIPYTTARDFEGSVAGDDVVKVFRVPLTLEQMIAGVDARAAARLEAREQKPARPLTEEEKKRRIDDCIARDNARRKAQEHRKRRKAEQATALWRGLKEKHEEQRREVERAGREHAAALAEQERAEQRKLRAEREQADEENFFCLGIRLGRLLAQAQAAPCNVETLAEHERLFAEYQGTKDLRILITVGEVECRTFLNFKNWLVATEKWKTAGVDLYLLWLLSDPERRKHNTKQIAGLLPR